MNRADAESITRVSSTTPLESVWNRINGPWIVLRYVGGAQGHVLRDQVRACMLDGVPNNISAIVRGLVCPRRLRFIGIPGRPCSAG